MWTILTNQMKLLSQNFWRLIAFNGKKIDAKLFLICSYFCLAELGAYSLEKYFIEDQRRLFFIAKFNELKFVVLKCLYFFGRLR